MGRKGEHISKTKYGLSEYLAFSVCIIVTIVMVVMLFNPKDVSNSQSSSDDGYTVIDLNSKDENLGSVDTSVEESSEDGVEYFTLKVDADSVYIGDLILVNNTHLYAFKDKTEIVEVYEYKNKKYKIGSGEECLFEKTILAANEFLGDFNDISGLTNVTMVSGYITEEAQNAKYESYIKSVTPEEAQKWGVKAGGSDHHTGLSFNLTLYPSGGKIGEGEYSWLTENAYRYGFILRYPEDKSEITSVKDNNHFRYVGIPHAEYMYVNNLTLEEYIEQLGKTNYKAPLEIKSGNKEYAVYYFPADSSSSETEIKIPEGFEYSVSGNNIDGFIVTVNMTTK